MRITISMLLAGALGLSAPALATWTDPVPVTEINTTYHDKAPFLSFDGRTLYFSRQDGPGWHYTRIYQATRQDSTGPFTAVDELSALVYSGGHVDYPWVSPDNLRMYYYRTEPGSVSRLKFTERASQSEPWLPGSNITELNVLGNVANPSLTADELTIAFASTMTGGQGGYDIWIATRADRNSPFEDVMNMTQLNSSANDGHSSIFSDGLTLYFASDRNGVGQLFKASRASLDEPFGNVEHLSFFDSPGTSVLYPSPSSDGMALYFTRSVNGGQFDIYVSYIPEPATLVLLGLGAVMLWNKRSQGTA